MNEKWNKTALPYVISSCSHVLNVGAAALYLDFERYEKLGSNYNGTVRCSTVGGNVRWLVARLIRRLLYVLNQFFIEETGMHVYLLKAKIPLIRKSRYLKYDQLRQICCYIILMNIDEFCQQIDVCDMNKVKVDNNG